MPEIVKRAPRWARSTARLVAAPVRPLPLPEHGPRAGAPTHPER